jgi:hypothetical protein
MNHNGPDPLTRGNHEVIVLELKGMPSAERVVVNYVLGAVA